MRVASRCRITRSRRIRRENGLGLKAAIVRRTQTPQKGLQLAFVLEGLRRGEHIRLRPRKAKFSYTAGAPATLVAQGSL